MMLTSCAVGVDKTFLMKMQMPFGPCTSALLPKLKLTPAVAPEMMSSDPKAVEKVRRRAGVRSEATEYPVMKYFNS